MQSTETSRTIKLTVGHVTVHAYIDKYGAIISFEDKDPARVDDNNVSLSSIPNFVEAINKIAPEIMVISELLGK